MTTGRKRMPGTDYPHLGAVAAKLLTPDERSQYEGLIVDHACRADIRSDSQMPTTLLLSGSEVHTRIRCGPRAMGYSLFYGVYEFTYEKVVFPYFHW